MGGSEQFDLLRVALDGGGKASGRENLVEGVADVFEFFVELLAVVLEPVLEAFQEVGGEVCAITRRIAVHRNFREPVGDERVVNAAPSR